MIRQALADYLLAQSSVTALVGERIRPLWLAQTDTYPAITFKRITAGHEPGISSGDDLPQPRFEILCWAETYLGAANLSELVRAALEDEGPNDTWTPSTGDVTVMAGTLLDEEDTFDENTIGGDKPIYGVRTVYEITYRD